MKRPLFTFASRHGTIFNITPALLKNYKIEAIQLFVGDFHQNRQSLKNLPSQWTTNKFLGLPESIKTYLTPYDFLRNYVAKTSNEPGHIKIQTDSGFVGFDHAKYNEMAKILKPDYLVGLTDYVDLNDKNSHKKAVGRVVNYLKSSNFKDLPSKTKVLLPLHMGPDINLTLECLQTILGSEQIKGIVLCNLFNGQSALQRELLLNQIKNRIQTANKSQFEVSLGGLGKLTDIEQTLGKYITIYEISYPFLLASKNIALVKENGHFKEKIPQLKDQLTPLSDNCLCYSCLRHNQAYIAHLIKCKQPNAKILLSLHNLQVYFDRLATLS